MRKTIYLVFIFILLSISLYSKTLFIESSAILYNGNISESSADVIYNFLYNGNRVYVYGCSKEDKLMIKEQFSDVVFLNRFAIIFYRIIYSKQSIFYAESENEVKRLEDSSSDYIHVFFNIGDGNERRFGIGNSSLIKLRNVYGKKILLGYEVRECIKIEIDKDEIFVIDGDTIAIDATRYRLLGIDAPEIEQEYGTNALIYMQALIDNAKIISISPADFDIYNRILAHLYIDDIPVAYGMIENKLSFQTISSFGDNGFPTISSNIIELSKKQGKMPFLRPSTYRDRVKKGETNNLTVKKPYSKKKTSGKKRKSASNNKKIQK